jgi:hypothetical protein
MNHRESNTMGRTMLRVLRPAVFLIVMLVVVVAPAAYLQAEQGAPPTVVGNEPANSDPQIQGLTEIMALYYAGDHEAVTKKSEAFLAKYPLTNENMGVLSIRPQAITVSVRSMAL